MSRWLFILLLPLQASAADVENRIRDYIHTIDSTQRNIASMLVLQNFSRFFIQSVDQESLNQQFSSYFSKEGQYNVTRATNGLFDAIYSEKLDKEKINDIVQLVILMRQAKIQWVNMGSQLQIAHASFYENFSKDSDVCSENNFSNSLTVLENFSPEGVDTSQLSRSWELSVGGELTVSDNGDTNFGYYVKPSFTGESDSEEAKHAVATTAGAAATFLPPPGNLIGPIAIPIAIEVIWGAIDMKKHIKEMEKIAQANEDLHSMMQFEVNVRKHFMDYCQTLKTAYIEARPLVTDIKTPSSLQKIRTEISSLRKKLGKELSSGVINKSSIFNDRETFYHFFKFKLLNEALLLNNYHSDYFKDWNQVLNNIDRVNDNMETALNQVITHKINQEYQPDYSSLNTLIKKVENFSNFKNNFYLKTINYFEVVKSDKREEVINDLKILIDNYTLYHKTLSQEESEFISNANKTIKKLRDDNA